MRRAILYNCQAVANSAEVCISHGEEEYRFAVCSDEGRYFAAVIEIEGMKMAVYSDDLKNWKPFVVAIIDNERVTAKELIERDEMLRKAHMVDERNEDEYIESYTWLL